MILIISLRTLSLVRLEYRSSQKGICWEPVRLLIKYLSGVKSRVKQEQMVAADLPSLFMVLVNNTLACLTQVGAEHTLCTSSSIYGMMIFFQHAPRVGCLAHKMHIMLVNGMRWRIAKASACFIQSFDNLDCRNKEAKT